MLNDVSHPLPALPKQHASQERGHHQRQPKQGPDAELRAGHGSPFDDAGWQGGTQAQYAVVGYPRVSDIENSQPRQSAD
jgi:hypothetical protein